MPCFFNVLFSLETFCVQKDVPEKKGFGSYLVSAMQATPVAAALIQFSKRWRHLLVNFGI